MQIIIKRRADGPSVPELGTPTSVTFDSVTVPLNRPSTGPAAISAYQIERATNAAGPWTIAATGALIFGNPATQYVDGGRIALTTYYYRAKATDTAGRESSYSATVSVTTAALNADNTADKYAIYWIGGDFYNQYQSAAGIENMARRQIAIILSWEGLEAARGVTNTAIVNAVKAASTVGTKVFGYYNPEAVEDPTDGARPTYTAKMESANWWLYQNGSSGTKVDSYFSSAQTSINLTSFTTADGDGLRAPQWITKFWRDHFGSAFDGLFIDNYLLWPRVSGDWNRDGSSDNGQQGGSETVANWWRAGLAACASYFRTLEPSKLIIGNTSDLWKYRAVGLGTTVPLLDQTLNGGISEFGLALDEPSYNASDIALHLRDVEDAAAAPKLVIFEHESPTGSLNDQQAARHGHACCRVVTDMYYDYSQNSGHAVHEWFNFMSFRLGTASESRRTAATHGTAWLRNFQHGVEIWWPQGSTSTVNLGGTFYALQGDASAWLTPGQAVTSVTAPPGGRNGIILSRVPT